MPLRLVRDWMSLAVVLPFLLSPGASHATAQTADGPVTDSDESRTLSAPA